MSRLFHITDNKRLTPEMKEKLSGAIELCFLQMTACGLKPGNIGEFAVNFRARRWGICKFDRITRECSIEINSRLLDDATPYRSLIETLMHEMCHTIRGGAGHTGAWKRAVTILNQTYGYNIKRVNSAEEKGVEETEKERSFRYELECTKCGQIYRRQKKSALVTHPERYRCRCGGTIRLRTS